jgi:hypothetical protein
MDGDQRCVDEFAQAQLSDVFFQQDMERFLIQLTERTWCQKDSVKKITVMMELF